MGFLTVNELMGGSYDGFGGHSQAGH